MKHSKLRVVASLLAALLMMLGAAASKNGKLFGIKLGERSAAQTATLSDLGGGVYLLNTTALADDVHGYAGPTPVEIRLEGGRVTGVRPLESDETPRFYDRLSREGLYDSWNGLAVEQALALEVDALTGATYSSQAVIENVRRGLRYASGTAAAASGEDGGVLTFKFLAVLAVAMAGCVLPLFVRGKLYRTAQLALNVGVLGLWGGTFVSNSLVTNYLSNGVDVAAAIVPLLLIAAAFVYPLLGRRGHYCAHLCPFGSLQELAGRCVKRKLVIKPPVAKWLTRFREALWLALMALTWAGLFSDWMDYELFTAFFFGQATWAVSAVAGAFVLLSLAVPRPYCRFVCPSGTLMRVAQGDKWPARHHNKGVNGAISATEKAR